ncbi:MAG: IS3 family transposase [Salinisphaera sp.]|nr:IS3 family transposase [Salinisphaera sp.]
MRYAFVAQQRAHYPVKVLCRVLSVSVSGFHAFVHRSRRPPSAKDARLRDHLHTIHAGSRGTYGRPRMVRALRACGHAIGPKRVTRLMREEGLRGRCKGRSFKPRTTNSRHRHPLADNVLDRRFDAGSARPAWVGDITYIATKEGWLYLATVISVQTRQVLGYSLAERMPDDLVQQAFLNAWTAASAEKGVLFHSDRGSQYASRAFRELIQGLGFVPSMSRKGNCWDNAVAESFFATLKNEEATGTYETKVEAIAAIATYIHGFYNTTRLHSALDYLSPNDYAAKLKQAA